MVFEALWVLLAETWETLRTAESVAAKADAVNGLFTYCDERRDQLFPALLTQQALQLLSFYLTELLPLERYDDELARDIAASYHALIRHLEQSVPIARQLDAEVHQALTGATERASAETQTRLDTLRRTLPTSIPGLGDLNPASLQLVIESSAEAYFQSKAVLIDRAFQGQILPFHVSADPTQTSEHVEFSEHAIDERMQTSADIARAVAGRYLTHTCGRQIADTIRVCCRFASPASGYADASASLLLGIRIVGEILGFAPQPAIAVTGELDKSGHVLPVGQLEKKIAAVRRRADMRQMLIPSAQFADSAGSDKASASLDMIPIKTFEEALRQYYGADRLASRRRQEHWGGAPTVTAFFGRCDELDTLERWILRDQCRIVAVLGIKGIGKTHLALQIRQNSAPAAFSAWQSGQGGIGKTDLSLRLAHNIQHRFERIYWHSLLNAPFLTDVLADMLGFLTDRQHADVPKQADAQIALLLELLQQRRCLLMLDNVETILPVGESAGGYRTGYDAYGAFFKKIGEVSHQSCLLLTSREKPEEIARLESRTGPVRSLLLSGLSVPDVRRVFATVGEFSGTEDEWALLVNQYGGNPLALELAARRIATEHAGQIGAFLQHGDAFFPRLNDLLDWHVQRLSDAEKELAYWLAIQREPLSITALQEDMLSPASQAQVPGTLQALEKRLPVEHANSGVTLQPVLLDYLKKCLIEQVCEEIMTGRIRWLNTHALLKASAKSYIREIQRRLILEPVLSACPLIDVQREFQSILRIMEAESVRPYGYYIPDQVRAALPALQQKLADITASRATLEAQLVHLLALWRERASHTPGYAGGNIVNLLSQLQGNLDSTDFSGLYLREVDLQNIQARHADFSRADFVRPVFTDVFSPVYTVAFNGDGTLLAAGSAGGEIRVWRMADRSQVMTLAEHTDWIRSLAFSPDNACLLSCADDGLVKLWELASGRCIRTLKTHAGRVLSVAFHPTGAMFASAGEDQIIRVWDTPTGREIAHVKGRDRCWVWSLAFHPDGTTLASGSTERAIRLWDLATSRCIARLQGHTNFIHSIAFNHDGTRLISGGNDLTIRLWDVAAHKCLKVFEGHSGNIRSIAYNSKQPLIASGSFDRTARIWDVETGQATRILQGHSGNIWSIAFHPDGTMLASGGEDQTVRIWDVKTGYNLYTLWGYSNRSSSVACAPVGDLVASADEDRNVRVWDIRTGDCLQTFQGHESFVASVAFHPEGKLIVSGSNDATIRLWDIAKKTCLRTFEGHTAIVRGIFSPDGTLLASCSQDSTIRLWDAETGECLRILDEHGIETYAAAFTTDARYLAGGGEYGRLCIWDLETGRLLRILHVQAAAIWSVAFSPDNFLLVSASTDATICVWEAGTWNLLKTLTGHRDQIRSVVFHPTDLLFASAGDDGDIRVWEPKTGECMRVLQGHTHAVWSVSFHHDGRLLASGGVDGTIRIWNWTTGECVRILKAPGPYEGMNITEATGLTAAQRETLKFLGAIEYPTST